MAAEILYLHDLEVEAIIPGLIASIVGYTVFGAFYGFEPIFGAQPGMALESPIQLPYYAALGIACGLVGIVYAKWFYGIAGAFHRLRTPRWVEPAVGGLVVGGIGLVLPQVLHTGYGWVQVGMSQDLLGLPLWVVLVLPFAKIVATGLSIGSGGSGGIFGPGMVIGGFVGAAVWRLGDGVLPGLPANPAPFVIVGMMALFGGIAHAPLAVMLMVAEMTGNLSLLAPAMIAVALSTALVGDRTIYRSQLPNRAASPAHRVRLSFPLLSSLVVRDAMTSAPALAADGPVLAPDQALDEALEHLTDAGASSAPVVEDGRVIGQLGMRDLVRTYKSTLRQSVRRATALPPETVLFDVTIPTSSPLVGRPLAESRLPQATLVVSILREGEVLFPRAATEIQGGDRLTVLASAGSEAAVRRYFAG